LVNIALLSDHRNCAAWDNVIVVLGLGILTAAIIGLSSDTFTGWKALQSIQKVIGWMQNLAIIALAIGGIVGL